MLYCMYMRDFSPFYTPFDVGFLGLLLPFVIVVAVAVLILKGFSLWYAARGGQKYWFIALLIVNTLGLLEIVYLLFFRPNAPYGTKSTPSGDSSPVAA